MQLRDRLCGKAAEGVAKTDASLQCSIPSHIHARAVDGRQFFPQNNVLLNHQLFIPDNNVQPLSMNLHVPGHPEPRYHPHIAHGKKWKLKFFRVAHKGLAE